MVSVAAKASLRKEMKVVLKGLSKEARAEQSHNLMKKLLAVPAYKDAKSVCLYLSLPTEVDTEALVHDLLQKKKKCYVPRYYNGGRCMDMVLIKDTEDLASLPLTKWGIRQPGESDEREEALAAGGIDLLIVPGLAFTSEGARLGRGGGYYDTWLRKARNGQRPFLAVALAFSQQVVENIPMESHDCNVDLVITPDEI